MALSGGLIVNSSITMAEGKAWFVEARNPDIMAAKTRQLGGSLFWKDQYLVCLDLESGQTLWSSALNIVPGEVALYMAHGGGKLVLVSSGSGSYHTYAFNDANGEVDWNVDIKWPQDHHGGHMARPAIVGETVYVRPSALSLIDGKILDIAMPGGGCGTYAATEKALFFRSGNVTMWDPAQGKTTSWNRLRPDCWLSTIPAAGLLLSPEGGGGCSCGSWMETSIVFAPKVQK
jgi:outer membrane protein assembly factor BamB